MAERSRSQKRDSSPGWLASLVGAIFLVSAGFMLGLVVGVVQDEPELVMNHITGDSQDVEWVESQAQFDPEYAELGQGSEGRPAYVPSGQGEGWPETEGELQETELVAYEYPPVDLRPPSDAVLAAPGVTPVAVQPPPKASARPPAVSARPPAGRTGFSVQVGAFAESAPAHKIADDLKVKGYRVYITPSAGSRDGRWRVRVGPLSTRERAQDVAQQLKVEEKLPTWVLSEGGG